MSPLLMRLGYNTNGLAHHRWDEALSLIADAGYQSVALTIDHHCLDPQSPSRRHELERLVSLLQHYELKCVIETGARFLLDPARKHQPTLLSPRTDERQRRLRFLTDCIDIAAATAADAVSFWSGTAVDEAPDDVLWERLIEGCQQLAEYAERSRVRLAFEPEPGMFIETCDQYARLRDQIAHPVFGLTLDLGHLHCLGDGVIAEQIVRFAPELFNIHIEDMLPGVHEHLRFGEGSMNFVPIFQALGQTGYSGGLHVELSRHSHLAPTVLRESFAFLTRCQEAAAAENR